VRKFQKSQPVARERECGKRERECEEKEGVVREDKREGVREDAEGKMVRLTVTQVERVELFVAELCHDVVVVRDPVLAHRTHTEGGAASASAEGAL
jgi:hypothetical protein